VRRGLATALAGLLLSTGALAQEQILRFDSEIRVSPDSGMQVTETLQVRAEGRQIRRGIFRDFPTDYFDRAGNRIRVGFEVVDVTRDGIAEPFSIERRANGVRVYIGDANRQLPPGEYEYRITYTTNRQLGYFDDHDELYWNVTGNGWAFPILAASATITLPPGVPRSAMAIEGYTGSMGATGRDYSAQVETDSRAFIRSTRALQSGEGLTVVVSWPKGVVVEPSLGQRAAWLLDDNRSLAIALGGVGVLAGYLFFAWSRFGRDPVAGPIFPHYEPPPGLSPGACRYVCEMGHDHQAFSAAVLNLAANGYLTIHQGRGAALDSATDETVFDQARAKLTAGQDRLLGPLLEMAEDALDDYDDDTFILEQNSPIRGLKPLGPGEQALFSKLFEQGRHLVLTNAQHRIVRAALREHEAALKKFYQRANFLTNTGLLAPAILIMAVTAILVFASGIETPLAVGALFLCVPLIIRFVQLIKAPTPAGRRLMDRIGGFRLYLSVAEADELARIQGIAGPSPERTTALFEQFLPYALALDVEQPWAEQFEPLFRRISAEQGSAYRPGWYVGRRSFGSARGFTKSMTGALGSAISASATPPGSSSGGGGGGSSGGGGGGGGGGGW
jgi:uncharacterized membrane protein YgcG